MTAAKGNGRSAPRAPQWRKKSTAPWGSPRAACRDAGHQAFFEDEATKTELEQAKRLCRGCIVREGCLESAMTEEKSGGGRYGIRGALLPGERKQLQSLRTTQANRAHRAQEEQEAKAAETAA